MYTFKANLQNYPIKDKYFIYVLGPEHVGTAIYSTKGLSYNKVYLSKKSKLVDTILGISKYLNISPDSLLSFPKELKTVEKLLHQHSVDHLNLILNSILVTHKVRTFYIRATDDKLSGKQYLEELIHDTRLYELLNYAAYPNYKIYHTVYNNKSYSAIQLSKAVPNKLFLFCNCGDLNCETFKKERYDFLSNNCITVTNVEGLTTETQRIHYGPCTDALAHTLKLKRTKHKDHKLSINIRITAKDFFRSKIYFYHLKNDKLHFITVMFLIFLIKNKSFTKYEDFIQFITFTKDYIKNNAISFEYFCSNVLGVIDLEKEIPCIARYTGFIHINNLCINIGLVQQILSKTEAKDISSLVKAYLPIIIYSIVEYRYLGRSTIPYSNLLTIKTRKNLKRLRVVKNDLISKGLTITVTK